MAGLVRTTLQIDKGYLNHLEFMRFRSLVFTDYNFTETDGEEYIELWKPLGYKFIVVQLERCPETDRLHWQGFVSLTKQRTRSKLQSKFPGLHCERRKGSVHDAIAYCEKQDTRVAGPYRDGDIPVQGKRTDIEQARELLLAGASELEIADANFGLWCRNRRSFSAYRNLVWEQRRAKTYSLVYWGTAGTGKTRAVYDTYGFDRVYDLPRPNGGSVWFDGLSPGHDVLLLDDFYGWLPLHLLLKLMDRYPLQVPTKGGMVNFNVKYLYITSNKPWTEWYDWSKLGHNLLEAFKRRIDEEVEFTAADLQ